MKNPHSASFQQGPMSSKSSPSKHQTISPAPDDIVLGSVDLQTIRENVSRLHVTQPPQSSSQPTRKEDGTSTSISSGDMLEESHTSLSEISSTSRHDSDIGGKVSGGLSSPQPLPSLSSLPDVVQQYGGEHEQAMRSAGDLILDTKATTPTSDLNNRPSAANLNGDSVADRKLEEHQSSTMLKGASMSLTQLQDPQTFTLGSPDEKKKNKITKANFAQAQGTLHSGMSAQDPADPLGSLDPLWNLAKK